MVAIVSKKKILQRAKSLSTGIFNRIFIAPGLKEKQQEHDMYLREHVILFKDEYKDQEIKIREGKVVRNEQGNRI